MKLSIVAAMHAKNPDNEYIINGDTGEIEMWSYSPLRGKRLQFLAFQEAF